MSQTRLPHRLWCGLALLLLVPTMSQAIEELAYEVVHKLGESVEIRRYAAYVVAEVLIAGPVDEAGNQAFPILAGYIFGKNKDEQKFAMTAPVTQTSAPAKFAMTAPVTQSDAEGGTLVSFVLLKDVTLTTAPEPIDERVKLREVAGHTLAAIRYSGFWSQPATPSIWGSSRPHCAPPSSAGPVSRWLLATTAHGRPGSCAATSSG